MFVNDTELSLRNIAGAALSDGKRKRPPRRAGTCAVRSRLQNAGNVRNRQRIRKGRVSICRFRFVTRVRLFHKFALKRFVFAI